MTLIYIGLVILIALVGMAGFLNLFRLEKAVDSLMTNNYKSINAATRMTDALDRQDGAVLVGISSDSCKSLDVYMEAHADFIKWYEVEVNNVTEQGEKKLVEEIGDRYGRYVKYFADLKSLMENNREEQARLLYYDMMQPLFLQIKRNLSEISGLNEAAMLRSKEEASSGTKQSMYFLLVLSFAAVIGGLAVSGHFVNRILDPLNQLSESISRVKAGELNQQILLKSNDETGRIAGEFNNMTQRLHNYEKSTLGQLMTEKNKSMAIVKSISDPLFVLDSDYRLVLVNDACEKFFSLVEDEIKGKHFLEVIQNGEIFNHITSAVQSGADRSERIIQLNRISVYYFSVVVAAVKDPVRHNAGIIVLLQNVTELKELEQVKTDFIATVSHEFKTPLTSIMMGASILSDEGMGSLNPEQQEVIQALKEDGEKLTSLVNELLELSRIESGKEIYQFSLCDFNAVMEACAGEFADQAERRGVALEIDKSVDLPAIYVDFTKISWALNNLISNALKYTTGGDTIHVTARREKSRILVSVKDNGAGILPEHIEHLFDKFYQGRDRDIEARGTGLGLYVAKEIVRAHGGEIWASSEPGKGSIFTFSIPIRMEQEEI